MIRHKLAANALTRAATIVVSVALLVTSAHAAMKTGKIVAIYADPGDFVVSSTRKATAARASTTSSDHARTSPTS